MELQAILVLCGVGVTVGAVLLLMLLFKSSGTSYEEAVAQQRQAASELLALAESKNKNKKNTKKDKKKQAKKEKRESAAPAAGSEPESGAEGADGGDGEEAAPNKHHVEFSPPTVVDVPADTPPAVKIRKRGKEPKVRPILLNKEDPSVVASPDPAPTPEVNHFEEIHPKDEFELRIALEKKEEAEKKPSKQGKAKSAKLSAESAKPAKPIAEPAKPSNESREESASKANGEAPKEQRKGKKEKKSSSSEDAVDSPKEEVIPPLNTPQPSELTTEKLLKQVNVAPVAAPAPVVVAAVGKNKKKKPEPNVLALMAGDSGAVNVGELVHVVRGAVLSRAEIQLLTDTLLNKQHDPLPQHSDWTEGPNDPVQKLKKQLAEKEKALADEVEASQAVHAKLKELRASLNAERARAAATTRAAEASAAELGAAQARLLRLQEDNHALQHDKHMLQQKLGAEAEAQRVQLEVHIQRLSESEATLVAQLAGLQAELQARVMEAGQARCEAAASRDAACMAQQHAADLAQQLQEANRAYSELDQQRQRAAHQEQKAQQEARQAHEKLAALSELQAEVSRVSARWQAAEKARDEAVHRQQQATNEISQLREQLAAKEAELAEVKQMKVAPAHNGLPPQDQHKAVELAKVEAVVEGLRTELVSAQTCVGEQREQLDALQAQLKQYQDKNNELRTKNWKVMEALQSAEKALQTKTHALPAQDSLREAIEQAVSAQQAEIASILRAAAPSAAPAGTGGKAWLQSFADNLRAELSKPSEQHEYSARLNELQAQNEQLQALVDKYKTIIDDTEGVLSRLQQNVSSEEARWGALLRDKQAELDALRLTTLTQLQNKIDSLEAELARTQAAHKDSFADHERLAEQRLMSAVSDKHTADLSNGPSPSQVSLEEK